MVGFECDAAWLWATAGCPAAAWSLGICYGSFHAASDLNSFECLVSLFVFALGIAPCFESLMATVRSYLVHSQHGLIYRP